MAFNISKKDGEAFLVIAGILGLVWFLGNIANNANAQSTGGTPGSGTATNPGTGIGASGAGVGANSANSQYLGAAGG